jgi:hypothetical protein
MEEHLKQIEIMLGQRKVPKICVEQNRPNFPEGHRRYVFGITRGRFSGKVGLSAHSKKYSALYELVNEFGKKYIPIEFNSIHINHNVICPKHKDSKNITESAIISCGQYTGCKLMIENVEHDTYYKIVVFDGSTKEHWNTDDLVGNRYSLIFYKTDLT